MRYCKHTQWLGLAINDQNIFLQSTDRLQTLLEDLPDPRQQKPCLSVFIGNRSKALAIKDLVKTFAPPPRYGLDPSCQSRLDDEASSRGRPKLNGRRAHGEIHLHIHASSVFSSRPVLLAEGDLPSLDKPSRAMTVEKCHEMESRQLTSGTVTTPKLSEYADVLYFRLLSPFTDVFCFFANDVGGLRPIVRRLALWLDLGQPSTLPRSTRPKVLIVTERGEHVLPDDESDLSLLRRMLSEETTKDASEQFSDIQLLSLPARRGCLSNKARHRELFELLLNSSDQVRETRAITQTLLSAHHLGAFFNFALRHVATNTVEPFNFITASRLENPVPRSLQIHLVDFLHNIKSPEKLIGFAIPVIASSFLLDNHPPGVHFFSPSEIFRTLYKNVCHQVCREGVLVHKGSIHMLLPSGFVKLLEDEFVTQVEEFSRLSGAHSAAWHEEVLSEFRGDWLTVRSVDSCFVCFGGRPQYGLTCGHIICENCVRRFASQSDDWAFKVHHCFLCRLETPDITIGIQPPTATVRLLSIDGGGVRGIIPLMFLQALEEKIGLPYPVQENFHYIIGTSSGGITALALSKNGWTVEDCMDHFVKLADVAFPHARSSRFGWIFQIYLLLRSLITDGFYPAHKLEALLRDVFGSDSKILDCSSATTTGIKIGITVSSMKPEPFMFTNYNGLGDREDSKSDMYGVLLGSVPVWEIARSTSAAPGFFTPKSIAGLGKFQDGGLKHNNPINLALKEIEALFPRDRFAKKSTLKVSLGTGKARDGDSEMYGSGSWWRDLWFFRLCRVLWSSIDSQDNSKAVSRKDLKRLRNELKVGKRRRRGEYFRLNIEFSGGEPRLDEPGRINEMKLLAQEEIFHSKQLDRLAYCIIAELFVFELESNPRKDGGRYSCTGVILCCRRAGTTGLESLLGRLAKSSAKFLLKGRTLPGSVQDRSSLARDGNFRKRVCFDVASKEDLISLHLREEGSESFHISGSPFSVDWLVEAQGLGTMFTRPERGKKRCKDTDGGSPKKRPRL